MKATGIILIIIGVMSLFGNIISDTQYPIGPRLMAIVIQLGLIVGGTILISKSKKNDVSQNDNDHIVKGNLNQQTLNNREEVSVDKWNIILEKNLIGHNSDYIYQNFLKPDKIDPDKFNSNYVANFAANNMGIEIYERIEGENINCTSTFREHYSSDIVNRGPSVPDWFYIAYPDVAYWIVNNLDIVDKINEDDELTLQSIRKIVVFYKNNVNSILECSN